MATTLKVKNTSSSALELDAAAGGGTVTVPPGGQEDLTEKQLKGKRFLAALEAGSITFTKVNKPSAEQISLASAVFPAMVSGIRDRMERGKNRFAQSQADLIQRQKAYNTAWNVSAANLTGAKSAVAGWPALESAVKNFLLDTAGESQEIADAKAAVKAIEDEIDALNKEDLAATNRTLAEWFADRSAKEQELAAARAAVEALEVQAGHPLAPTVESGSAVADALSQITQDQAIGKEIPGIGP
jgi:hypothetical protein